MYDLGLWLENGVKVGDTITGTYTYGTDAQDLDIGEYRGYYVYSTAPYGFSMWAGKFNFETDPTQVDFSYDIINDNHGDMYRLVCRTICNQLPQRNLTAIEMNFGDEGGTAISDTALPTIAPYLNAWGFKSLRISGGSKQWPFSIYARITSAEVIPEPATILLLGLGGLFARRKFRRR